jgi:hypothetical protein
MAKFKFPFVSVLLIGGAALAVYLLTRPREVPATTKPAERAPNVPPSGIATPQTPGAPPAQAYTRLRNPYMIQPAESPIQTQYPTPNVPVPVPVNPCLSGQYFIPENNPLFNQIRTEQIYTNNLGIRGKCVGTG